MAECIIQKAGGGTGSDECTATKDKVLAGYTAVTSDSGDEATAGTMANKTNDWWTARDSGYIDTADNASNGLYGYIRDPGYYDATVGIRTPRNVLADRLGIVADKVRAGYSIAGVAGNPYIVWTGDANANQGHVLSGETFYRNGVKYAGTMKVNSVVSFRAAPYSVDKIVCTWQNPSKGPYGYFSICGKTGGYPPNANTNRLYLGAGTNAALGAQNSMTISGLAAGQTYYFRIWAGVEISNNGTAEWYWQDGYGQTTAATTAHGRQAFTASGTFTVPAGVRSIDIHCTGGGGSGHWGTSSNNNGGGGGGGYTSYKNGVAVTPGQAIPVIVGAGAIWGTDQGETSSALSVSAEGGWSAGHYKPGFSNSAAGGRGGSGGGSSAPCNNTTLGGSGGSNGADGQSVSNRSAGIGQGSTTKEFGSGTLYSGAGGGGCCANYVSTPPPPGGDGGGGTGATYKLSGVRGTNGSGGGGGGGNYVADHGPGYGGSGNVIIRW